MELESKRRSSTSLTNAVSTKEASLIHHKKSVSLGLKTFKIRLGIADRRISMRNRKEI
jgi:hypothetical protein